MIVHSHRPEVTSEPFGSMTRQFIRYPIVSERLILSPFRETDFEALYTMESDRDVNGCTPASCEKHKGPAAMISAEPGVDRRTPD